MNDEWDDRDASTDDALAACVYCTRLIGADPSLVLHGGGNSSVKVPFADVTGAEIDALWVKGSGWDMGSIEAAGFAPLRRSRLAELLALPSLSDPDMARELNGAKLDPSAPNPSVESLLHAYLPHHCVQHSHADRIINLTNIDRGEQSVREIYGDDVVVIPYVKPGFDLARLVTEIWPDQSTDDTKGMVLLNHGLFTFGDDAREAYLRHVELITRAEHWLDERAPFTSVGRSTPTDASPLSVEQQRVIIHLRRDISDAAGEPMLLRREHSERAEAFVGRSDLAEISTSGPLTPDHVIRTKRVPLVGTDVAAYVDAYDRYFDDNKGRYDGPLERLDPAPRVVVDSDLGLWTAGRTWSSAEIAADIYHHTMEVIERSTDHLGGYQALPASDIFDVEYWDLEQAKLRRQPAPASLAGQVAVVTGAASGIGRACAVGLAEQGATVIGVDIDPAVGDVAAGPGYLGLAMDLTRPEAGSELAQRAVGHGGGVDIAVLSAGILGRSHPIAEFDLDDWQRVHRINLESTVALMSALHPALAASPAGGRVVAIASKNVAAPGPGAGAYSTTKAALMQLVRVAALEWAPDGIRVNAVHPDAVFDTGLWSDEVLRARADKYAMSVEEYKRRNLLSVDITSVDVAAGVIALCSEAFRATTGAGLPIDGGNERVI